MILRQVLLQLLDNMKIKKMKRILILSFVICFVVVLKAQQLPQITQYTSNNYAINPATSGMYDYYQVNTTIRNQWVGINEAPRTSVISIYGKHSENVGLGGTVYNDVAGPTSRSGAAASYTYSFPLSAKMKISLALQAGFTQFKIIKDQQKIEDQNDPFFSGGDVIRVLPDATFGFNISSDKWYIGAAIPQLLSSELRLMDENDAQYWETSQNGKLASHVYILGAYMFDVNTFLSIEPSLLMKSVSGAKTQTDLGIKVNYKELFWIGANQKINNDLSAMGVLFGFTLNDRYNIGYSYDMPSAKLSSYSSGSHEFMFGIRLSN